MDLAVVDLDGSDVALLFKFHLDLAGQSLIASEKHSLLGGGDDASHTEVGDLGAGDLEEFGDDAIDVHHLGTNVFDDGASGTFLGKIASDDLDDSGDSGERIANLVGESGGEFAEGGEVLGA